MERARIEATSKRSRSKNWLRVTDRTRQRNGFLDYSNPDGERPRLVTRGLDHIATGNASPPAYKHYLSDPPREHEYTYVDPTIDPTYLFYLQDVDFARKRQDSLGIKHSSSLSDYLHRRRSIRNIFPCIKSSTSNPTTPESTNKLRTSTFGLPSIYTNNQSHDDVHITYDNQLPNPTATPPYLDSGIKLVFPGTSRSAHAYIRQTRPGIKRSTSASRALAPSLHRAGLGMDPYAWNDWYTRKQRKGDVDAHLRFFLWRKRRSLNSRARIRGEDGMGDIGPREMEREAQEIFATMDRVWEGVATLDQ